MKKKGMALVAAAVIAFGFGVIAKDAYEVVKAQLRPDFTIVIDGEVTDFENVNGETVYPILHNGTTYLPVRAIGEIMGKTVYWYEDDKRIELREKLPSTVTDADVLVLEEHKKANTKQESEGFITAEEAKKIALDKAGFKTEDVKFLKAELDEDDGVIYYDVEFISGGVEHELEIGAVNGAVLDFEVDRERIKPASQLISAEKAKEIALKKAGLTASEVIFEKVELDEDDGIMTYEIEFKKGNMEYEAQINAADGKILEWEAELDD